MSDLWPQVTCETELDALAERGDSLYRGIAAISGRHGFGPIPVEHMNDGSLPVFALDGGIVLKLYPQIYRDDFLIESRVLDFIAGRVAAPTPVATGEIGGWSYLAMTRLPGQPLSAIWDELTPANRSALAEEVGVWLRTLHALPVATLQVPGVHWPEFLQSQRDRAVEAQQAGDLGPPWLARIAPFLAGLDLPSTPQPALLHTEIMRAHVFAENRAGRWRLSGVLDFEPSMLGAAEYEFASVGIFLTGGDAPVLRQLLLAYGYRHDQLDHQLQCRFMAYALLHRYSRLGWYLRRMPPGDGVDTLAGLAAQWWALPGVSGR